MVRKNLPDLVGPGQHCKRTELDGTVPHGVPAGEGLHAALVVHEVLVQRRGVLGEPWKPEPCFFARQGDGRRPHDSFHELHELRLVREAVE